MFMAIRLLEINEIQSLLGIGRNKVYNLLQTGEIAAFKIGKAWKVTSEDVEAYLEKQREENYYNSKYGSVRP